MASPNPPTASPSFQEISDRHKDGCAETRPVQLEEGLYKWGLSTGLELKRGDEYDLILNQRRSQFPFFSQPFSLY